ncbi:MAG: tryptophan--tRNA ligase, partial [Planctomycetota bacterium]
GRQNPNDPGDPTNALFQYVETFIEDPQRVAELKDRYARGDNIGDGHIKQEVAEAVNALLEPMRQRRARYEGDDDTILDILKAGCIRANEVAEETLDMARQAASLKFFGRELKLR